MGYDGWITIGVTVAMVLVMALSWAGPDLVLMAGLAILLTSGVIDPAQAFSGFSNPAVLTIAALLVVAAGMHETGAMDVVARRLLGRPRSLPVAQLRMMVPIAALSAFLNNTPVVAMMVPIVSDWSRRINMSASRFLLPLSYAAILGGTCTLIGTSTNLVVAGMAMARDPSLHFSMFDITWLGLPVLVVGTMYILAVSKWLLPAREGKKHILDNPREYLVAMRVEPDSPVVGSTIERAGLRHLPGLYLVEIERDGTVTPAVSPNTRLHANDVLKFAGIVESVVDLRKIRGLAAVTESVQPFSKSPDRRLVEAIISPQSTLIGRNAREAGFRTMYNAAILAVHREGQHVRQKVGDIEFEAGDVLLLETRPNFLRNRRNDGNFALISEVERSTPPRHDRAWIATLILLAMVIVNVAGLLPLVVASLLAAGLMLVTRCVTGQQARRSLEIHVLMAIAAAFGIGAALESSGAAREIGNAIVEIAVPLGPVGLLSAIYITTAALAGVATTKAAAALMFPIAASAAEVVGIPLVPLSLVLMIAASTAFSTPIGFQTNLMVFGPGGYRFADFLRIGVPLQVLTAIVTITTAWALWL